MGGDPSEGHVEFGLQASNFKASPHDPHDGELSLRKNSISEERTREFLRDVKLGAWNCNTTPAMQVGEIFLSYLVCHRHGTVERVTGPRNAYGLATGDKVYLRGTPALRLRVFDLFPNQLREASCKARDEVRGERLRAHEISV